MEEKPVIEKDSLLERVEQLYTPLEAAVEELKRRRKDRELCATVAQFCSASPPTFLPGTPVAIISRAIISADNEFARFKQLAGAIGLPILPLEMSGDRFYHFNPEKRRRGKLVFRFLDRLRTFSAVDFNHANGMPLCDIPTLSGMPLVEFHRRLLAEYCPDSACRVKDNSNWLKTHSHEWPYIQLIPGISDGIIFESFLLEDCGERKILTERILPTADKIVREFGVKPLIVRLFTPEEERESWIWQYPGELFKTACALLKKTGMPDRP